MKKELKKSLLFIIVTLVIYFSLKYFGIKCKYIDVFVFSIFIVSIVWIDDNVGSNILFMNFKGRICRVEALLLLGRSVLLVLTVLVYSLTISYLDEKHVSSVFFATSVMSIIPDYIINIGVFLYILFFLSSLLILVAKRFHDFNMPGYFVFGFLPIICWIIGIRIFQAGYKVLGVMVFLNLFLAFPFFFIISGDKGTNYYGMNPNVIREYRKKVRNILESKSLTEEQKQELMDILVKDFEILEIEERCRFINFELEKLILQEKLDTRGNEQLNSSRRIYFEKVISDRITFNYISPKVMSQ